MDEKEYKLILDKIEKIEKKIEENNEILRGERNSKRWAFIFKIIHWVIIIGIGIVMWSYLEPVYNGLIEMYDTITTKQEDVNKTYEKLNGLKEKIDKLKNISF